MSAPKGTPGHQAGEDVSRRRLGRMVLGAALWGMAGPVAPGFATQARVVCVDLSRFRLYAVERQEIVLSSRVVVGMPVTPTPAVTSHLTHIRFRPSWRPTRTIREHGGYADRVWPPGDDNPLGLATVHFEDGGLIYLHGTNEPELFDQSDRALSYGCVRVELLPELISWVMSWPRGRTHESMHGDRSFTARTPPIPLIMSGLANDQLMAMLNDIDSST